MRNDRDSHPVCIFENLAYCPLRTVCIQIAELSPVHNNYFLRRLFRIGNLLDKRT